MMYFIGFLQAEIVLQKCGGNLLAVSRWYNMFLEAKVFISGIKVSFLGGKHDKSFRYAYHCQNSRYAYYWLRDMQWILSEGTGPSWFYRIALKKMTERNWLLLDYSELLLFCQWAAVGWLAFYFECIWWTVSKVISLLTHKLCLVDACLLEGHGTFVDPSKHPCLYGKQVCCKMCWK